MAGITSVSDFSSVSGRPLGLCLSLLASPAWETKLLLISHSFRFEGLLYSLEVDFFPLTYTSSWEGYLKLLDFGLFAEKFVWLVIFVALKLILE